MTDWQQRVIAERNELSTKLEKLRAFITGETFETIPIQEQQRLLSQEHAMSLYGFVLNQRIYFEFK